MPSKHLANQNTSRDVTATQRFFALPEMVSLLCTCCSAERIDLITLASVSHFLRAIALPHWARYLDVALSTADKKLNFFVENPALLHHIRYLRIRDDTIERQREYHRKVQASSRAAEIEPTPHWNELKLLLALIATTSSSLCRPPAIDITIRITQVSALETAFRPFPRLHHQVVALQPFIDLYGGRNVHQELQDLLESWQQNWTLLARFIQHIDAQGCSPPLGFHDAETRSRSGSAPGLRLFHFPGHDWFVPAVPLNFWTALSAATASSLRSLTLSLGRWDSPEEIWPLLAHRQLSKLVFISRKPGPFHCFDKFLDHNQSTLEDLHIGIREAEEALSFRQDFPLLQYFWCEGPSSLLNFVELRNKFVQRHSQIKGIIDPFNSSNESGLPCGNYPNLRALCASGDFFEEHALQGGRLSHACTFLGLETLYTESWLTRIPDAAKAITCLEVLKKLTRRNVFHNDAYPHFRPAFSSDLLPNLAELTIRIDNNTPRCRDPLSGCDLAQVFADLCPAKSLRVLHLFEPGTHFFRNRSHLLTDFPDARFPTSFEYFVWHIWSRYEAHYYRFVPSSQQGSQQDESKRGHLQQISSFFRTRITKEGVWDRTLDAHWKRTIYDHTPLDGPVMRLS